MEQIKIPISEYDIELLQDLVYKGVNNFTWTFKSNKGNNINVEFIKDEEGLL